MMSRNKIDNALYAITMGLCILALLFLPFQQGLALKWLRAAGEVALLAIIISPRKYFQDDSKYIAATLLVLATMTFLWFRIYKTPDSEYVGAYMNYRDWSLVGIFSAFVIPVMASARENAKKIINTTHLIIALLINVIYISAACYQFFVQGETRATLSLAYGPGATAAAYIITFMSLYTFAAILTVVKKFRFPLLLVFGFANLIAISATGTRAGIIIFPFIIAFILWNEIKGFNRKGKIICVSSFITLAVITALLLAKPIANRVDDLKSDLTKYNQDNTETSVGARFAMYETGIRSSYSNFVGQSLEERNEKIIAIVENDKDKDLSGALRYLNTHLHNQLIDTLSTTGWLGVTLNIIFLLSVTIFTYKKKFPLIYAYVAALILYSMSDVVAYAIPIPMAWLLTLAVICSLINNRENV